MNPRRPRLGRWLLVVAAGNDLGVMTADLIGSAIGATAWMLLRRLRPDGTKSP